MPSFGFWQRVFIDVTGVESGPLIESGVNNMDFGQLISLFVGGGALTALGAALNGWIKARSDAKTAERKVKSETDMAEDAQEFNQQAQIIANQGRRIEHLEAAIAECVSDRADLRYKVGHLEGRLDEQGRNMQHLQSSTQEQNRDAVKLAGEVAAKGVEVAAQLVATAAGDSALRLQQQELAQQQNADKPTEKDLPAQDGGIH
jgi:hypothetical protein